MNIRWPHRFPKKPATKLLPLGRNSENCAKIAICYDASRAGLDMNVSLGPRWESFVAAAVEQGRYGSASEVVREGLRLVEEREARLAALRETLDKAIERGGSYTGEEARQFVRGRLAGNGVGVSET